MTDYIMICKCGWECYADKLAEAKTGSKAHVKGCAMPEVYIDRERDFGSGMELDDSFKSVIIR